MNSRIFENANKRNALPIEHASLLRRAGASNRSLAKDALLHLQRQYGNAYVQRLVELSRQGDGKMEIAPEVHTTIERKRGGGQALESDMRSQMEAAFGADFSGVRVHTDSEADTLSRQLNARAFTTGKDIYFKQEMYNTGSSSGRELLAHELTHVVQQTGVSEPKLNIGQPGDKYEQEADQVAKAVVQHDMDVVSTVGEGGRALPASALPAGVRVTMAQPSVSLQRAVHPPASVQKPDGPAANSEAVRVGVAETSASSPASDLRSLVGNEVRDGAGYTFKLQADGNFQIVGAPPAQHRTIGRLVRHDDPNPKLASAWQFLADKLLKEHPVPAETAAPEADAEAEHSTWIGGALTRLGQAVSGGFGALFEAVFPREPAPSSGLTGEVPPPTTGARVDPTAAEGAAEAAPKGATEESSVPTPGPATTSIAPENHQSGSSFIKPDMPDTVTGHATTAAILDAIWPYFHAGDIVIGGYLSPGQQAWKVNYHWELVIWVCDAAADLDISEESKTEFARIAQVLRGNAPNPASGYLNDSQMAIADTSDLATCDARYVLVKQAKKDLDVAIASSGATTKVSGWRADRFQLAPQFIKPAGKSKHGTGYALDVKGNNERIKDTAATLGRSLVDDEDYHVHIEFAAGVKKPEETAT